MNKRLLKIISGIGLVIVVLVAILLFILFSDTNNPKVKLNPYLETIFLKKFNSTIFEYNLTNLSTSSNLITPTNLPMYKYTLENPVDFRALLINKYKLNSSEKNINYEIDKNTNLVMTNSTIQINFKIASQSSVLGFNTPSVNVKKAFEYLKEQGVELDSNNYETTENYLISGGREYVVSNKTNGELQSITLYPKLKEFSYIIDSPEGLMNLTFNKANDLLSITINSPIISNYSIETTDLYLEYLNLNEVLTKENIDKNGIFLPYYSASQKVTISNMEYVYLPSKDNYLIPFIRLSDKLGLNEILVPIVNPSRIVYE